MKPTDADRDRATTLCCQLGLWQGEGVSPTARAILAHAITQVREEERQLLDVAEKFHAVAVKERDAARLILSMTRVQLERTEAEVERLRGVLERIRQEAAEGSGRIPFDIYEMVRAALAVGRREP